MIEIKNLVKIYKPKKGVPVRAVDGVNLTISDTGMVFILGKSGSGKSTMLNLLGGLDKYDEGEIVIKGKSSKDFSQSEFDSLRNTYVGFIFQEYNILNEFNVGQNIALAMELQGKKATSEALNTLLDMVDLTGFAKRKPNELSGGQKQRVAIARALIKNPEIIMADEPTGALDSNTGRQVLETLKKLSKHKLVIVVSHDREFAEKYGDRIIEMSDGKILSDTSKYTSQGKNVSEGVSIIDDKVLQIKKGYTLSEEDFKLIRDYIENATDDTFISLDSDTNKGFKQAAKIDDTGNREAFARTEEDNVQTKTYQPSDFKLIKSRLPQKNALKIGASSLKAKPVRLLFTIFLAAVAFTLFGLSDTFGTYDKYKTTTQSIIDSNIDYASFSRTRQVNFGSHLWHEPAQLRAEDVSALQEKFPEMGLISVYGKSGYEKVGLNGYVRPNVFNKQNAQYFRNTIAGFAAANQEFFDKMGYTLSGALPQNDKEVIITAYLAEHYTRAGWVNPANDKDTLDAPAALDLIGRQISISGKSYTICGILDTKADEANKYERFKNTTEGLDSEKGENGIADYLMVSEMDTYIGKGTHALVFTTENFLAKNFTFFKASPLYGQSGYGNFTMGEGAVDAGKDNGVYADNVLKMADLPADGSVAMLGGKSSADLGDREVLVPVDFAMQLQMYGKDKPSGKEVMPDYNCDANFKLSLAQVKNKTALYHYWADKRTDLKNTDNDTKAMMMLSDLSSGSYNWDHDEYLPIRKQLDQNMLNDLVAQMNKAKTKLPVLTYSHESFASEEKGESVTFTVAGFYTNYTQGRTACFVVNDNGFATTKLDVAEYTPISFVVGKMPTDPEAISQLVNFNYGDKSEENLYPLENIVTVLLNQVNNIIEPFSRVFLYIGLGFAVFASFMLLNFISTSISYKKREIGVLRAVGARSNDVFRIFFSESFIIALINWGLAAVASAVSINVINTVLRNEYGLQLTLLNFGPRQVVLLLIISIFVAFISSFFPVMAVARKKPIDAIAGK